MGDSSPEIFSSHAPIEREEQVTQTSKRIRTLEDKSSPLSRDDSIVLLLVVVHSSSIDPSDG